MDVINTYSIDTITKFITPMVFKDNIKYSQTLQNYSRTYLSIIDKPEYDDKIVIVSNTPIIDKKHIYYNTMLVVTLLYEPEINKYLNIFHIPEQYQDDVYLIIAGKYSEISPEYKRKLLYFWEQDKDSRLFGILYKDKTKVFGYNQYMMNKKRIDKSNEYYEKPSYYELVYGLQI